MSWLNNLFKGKPKRIFLDYASATPVLPEVLSAMEKYWSREFYNPNAIYVEGIKVKKEVEKCRDSIAKILCVSADSIIFTSGGTEANTLAVRGVKQGKVIFEEESHPSISEAIIESKSPLHNGRGKKEIVLVSSVTTDNKLGRQIREERKKKKSQYPLLHIDASQTAQYFDVGLERLACDLLTLDSAKLYGPKGVGALIVRRGVKLDLPPQGTPPVPLIAGFARALEIAVRDREKERERLSILSNYFRDEIKKNLPEAEVSIQEPNIVNVSVPGILPEFLVLKLDHEGVMVSAGPACNFNKPEPPDTPVRFSFGRFTTESDIRKAIEVFIRISK